MTKIYVVLSVPKQNISRAKIIQEKLSYNENLLFFKTQNEAQAFCSMVHSPLHYDGNMAYQEEGQAVTKQVVAKDNHEFIVFEAEVKTKHTLLNPVQITFLIKRASSLQAQMALQAHHVSSAEIEAFQYRPQNAYKLQDQLQLLKTYIKNNIQEDLSAVLKAIKPIELHSLFKELKKQNFEPEKLAAARTNLVNAYVIQQQTTNRRWTIAVFLTFGLALAVRGLINLIWGKPNIYFDQQRFNMEAVLRGKKYYWENFDKDSHPSGHVTVLEKLNRYGNQFSDYQQTILEKQNSLKFNHNGEGEVNKIVNFDAGSITATVTGTCYQLERYRLWEELGNISRKKPNFFQDIKQFTEFVAKYEKSLEISHKIAESMSYPSILTK